MQTPHLNLPNGSAIDILGIGRLKDNRAEWWDLDGRSLSKPPVEDSELKGFETVLALRLHRYSSATPFMENGNSVTFTGDQCVTTDAGIVLIPVHVEDNGSSRAIRMWIAGEVPEILARTATAGDTPVANEKNDNNLMRVQEFVSEGTDQTRAVVRCRPAFFSTIAAMTDDGEIVAPTYAQQLLRGITQTARVSGHKISLMHSAVFALEKQRIKELHVRHFPRVALWIRNIPMSADAGSPATSSVTPVDLTMEEHRLRSDRDDGSSPDGAMPSEAVGLLLFGKKVTGHVVDKLGQPVAGVPIVLIDYRKLREIDWNQSMGKPATTSDSKGQFQLNVRPGRGSAAAVDGNGIGMTEYDVLADQMKIVFEPWGQIEGTLTRQGKPISGAEVSLTGNTNHTATKTDSAGHYTLGRIAAGNVTVSTTIDEQTLVDKKDACAIDVLVTRYVAPGQVTTINIGGKGTNVVGLISVPDKYADRIQLDGFSCRLERILPDVPYPPGMRQNLSDEKKKWFNTWLQTDDGRQHDHARLTYRFRPNEDGVFVLHDVPAGEYKLAGWSQGGKANRLFVKKTVTVSEVRTVSVNIEDRDVIVTGK